MGIENGSYDEPIINQIEIASGLGGPIGGEETIILSETRERGEMGKEKMKIKKKDTESDKDFKEKWNNFYENKLNYKIDGNSITVGAGKNRENERFITISKKFKDSNGEEQEIYYRLNKNEKGYFLSIKDEQGNISEMEDLTEEEIKHALENIQKRIDEGEKVKKQERDKQREVFDTYANNQRQNADDYLEKELNNLA